MLSIDSGYNPKITKTKVIVPRMRYVITIKAAIKNNIMQIPEITVIHSRLHIKSDSFLFIAFIHYPL
jgi:hypothetical protein